MVFRAFSEGEIRPTLQNVLARACEEIDRLDNDYVLKASQAELEQHFVSKASRQPVVLHTDQRYIEDQSGTRVDVSRDFRRAVFQGEPLVVQGTCLEIAIPFEGDPALWRIRPSRYTPSGYPKIDVRDDSIKLTVAFADDAADPDGLKRIVESQIESLAGAVSTLQSDVASHNASVPGIIKYAIERKHKRALKATNAVAALGIPVKRTAGPPAYTIPTKRRKTPTRLPPVATEQYKPEPVLDDAEYQHILRVTGRMSIVIERNPKTFASLDEKSIRDHFLLQLNGHYEGDATGETFNASGKTDILIRVEDRNVFIAECKFWRGPQSFSEAIDQLLRYLSWRDSKCALLIFNKRRDSSAVEEKMHGIMTERPEHRKTLAHDADGDSRYIFVKESDAGRQIIIATQLFDVPADADTETI